MNRKQRIIVSVTGIFIVLLILVGLTYAYFLTQISGNTNSKSIGVTTADLKLVYGDGNGIITVNKIKPGDEIPEKTFTVTNNGNKKVENYIVYLKNVTNTLERIQDLVYNVTCVQKNKNTQEVTGTCNGIEHDEIFPVNTGMVLTNSIEVDMVQEYTFKLRYKNLDIDQSIDMNKEIEGTIDITDIKSMSTEMYKEEDTLAYKIINNAMTKANGTELVSTPPSKVTDITKVKYTIDEETQELKTVQITDTNRNKEYFYADSYKFNDDGTTNLINFSSAQLIDIPAGKYIATSSENVSALQHIISKNDNEYQMKLIRKSNATEIPVEKVLSITNDNNGISYYYRGTPEDNYINFNDMCWRILRIEGDGAVKLLLADKDNICNSSTFDKSGVNSFIEYGKITNSNYLNLKAYNETNIDDPNVNTSFILNKFLYGGNYSYYTGELDEETFEEEIATKTFAGFTSENISYLKSDNYYLDDFTNMYDENGNITQELNGNLSFLNRKRLSGMGEIKRASLIYGNNIEKFNSKIGLISADEAVYAGSYSLDKWDSNYNSNTFINVENMRYWTISSFGNFNWNSFGMYVIDSKRLIVDFSSNQNDIRPTITLNPGTQVTGNGTINNPYELF